MSKKVSENKKILNELVEKYKEKQLDVAIEEMSELIQAICKHKRGKTDFENITEEIADVLIMIEQLIIYFGINSESINEMINNKIKRTKERLL